jgi:hypothetical protein
MKITPPPKHPSRCAKCGLVTCRYVLRVAMTRRG